MTEPEREQPAGGSPDPEQSSVQREAADAVGRAMDELGSRRRSLAGLGVGSVMAGLAGGFLRRGATLLLATLTGAAAACAPDRPPVPGDRLPDSELEVVDPTGTSWSPGDSIMLSDLEGRPILLDFWASWCPPCREQHRHVSAVAERYGDRLAVLGVLVEDTPENALRWMAEQGAAYPTVRELDAELADAFWIPATGLPHMAILDARRRLMWHQVGASATGIPDHVLVRLDSLLVTLEAEVGR